MILLKYLSHKMFAAADQQKKDNTIRTQMIIESVHKKHLKQQHGNANFFKSLLHTCYDYCASSSIHGMQYLGERRSVFEKIFWLCAFGISICCCFNLINNLYWKWHETPIIVSFSEKSTPVWGIPFPAVTICSETKRQRNVANDAHNYGKYFQQLMQHIKFNASDFNLSMLPSQELHEFRTLLQICDTQIIDAGMPVLYDKPTDYLQTLQQMLPDFERYFSYCKWFSQFAECEQYFSQTFTEEGLCYTFNGLNATDLYREHTFQYQQIGLQQHAKASAVLNRTLSWSLEQGYAEQSSIKTYPARVLGAGARAGLFVALQSFQRELDYACRGPIQGYKVLLHSPDDAPYVSNQYIRIPMNREVIIAVKPNMITTSAGISEYHPLRRQCYLNSERHLSFFKTYTQNNCVLECLANYTLNKCGCVKFSMPRLLQTPVCDESKIHCFDRAEDDLLLQEFKANLRNAKSNYRGSSECHCMPACTSLVYNTEISQADFNLKDLLSSINANNTYLLEYPDAQMSRLMVYFKENQFITSKRSELYGIADFLANCGGIFSLFIGFSILSLVEILYYFTLRLCSNVRANADLL